MNLNNRKCINIISLTEFNIGIYEINDVAM